MRVRLTLGQCAGDGEGGGRARANVRTRDRGLVGGDRAGLGGDGDDSGDKNC